MADNASFHGWIILVIILAVIIIGAAYLWRSNKKGGKGPRIDKSAGDEGIDTPRKGPE